MSSSCQGQHGDRQGHVCRSSRFVDHIASTTRQQRTGSGASLENPKILPQSHSSNKSPPLKGSLTFPNNAASWGPNIQTHELKEDISHSNQKNLFRHWSSLSCPVLIEQCGRDKQSLGKTQQASVVGRSTARLYIPGCSENQVSRQNSGYIAGSGVASSSSSEHLSVCFQRLSLTLNSVCLLHVWSTVSKN